MLEKNQFEKVFDLEDEKKKDREAEENEVQEVQVTRKKPKKKKRGKFSAKSRHSSVVIFTTVIQTNIGAFVGRFIKKVQQVSF